MNFLTKTIGTLILVMTISAVALAGKKLNSENKNHLFAQPAPVSVSEFFTDIPPFVTDTNFRWWQPPQPVPVIPSLERMDVAWTNGQVIFYNPHLSSQIPVKVAAFILAHEYGHIYGQTADENASDAFAARVYAETDKSVCQATAWFMTYFPNPGDWTHPPSPVRARNIARACGI